MRDLWTFPLLMSPFLRAIITTESTADAVRHCPDPLAVQRLPAGSVLRPHLGWREPACPELPSSLRAAHVQWLVDAGVWRPVIVHAQSCPTLCDPTDGGPPSSPVHGLFPARIPKGCRSLLQAIFPIQGSNLHLLHLHSGRQILYHWASETQWNTKA